MSNPNTSATIDEMVNRNNAPVVHSASEAAPVIAAPPPASPSTAPSRASVASQIEALVSKQAGPHGAPVTVQQNVGGSRFNSATGEYQSFGTPAPAGPIKDEGQDIAHESAQIMGRVSALQAQLDAVEFNRETGERTFKVADPVTRATLTDQLARAQQAAAYDIGRLEALQAQRTAQATAQRAAQEEEAAKFAFTRGDPAREKLWNEAMQRKEAEMAADRVIAARLAAAGIKR